ncbi:hypothetical protein CMEL01_09104, partial [Colletotrichum melonis]
PGPPSCWPSCLFGHRELHISTGLRLTWSVDPDCGGRFLDAHWSTRSELHSFAIRHCHAMPISGRERERERRVREWKMSACDGPGARIQPACSDDAD